MRWIFVAVLLLAASVAPARADISRHTCAHYFGDSENAPPEAQELLRQDSRAALQACSVAGDPDTSYFMLVSAPLHHPFGICQITARRVFKEEGGWTHTPPPGKPYLDHRSVSMMVAEEDCPRQDDPRYVVTNDVSPGVFLAAVRFWEKLSSASNPEILAQVTFPAARASTIFRDFENEFSLWRSFRLVSVSFSSADAHSLAYYHLDLEGTPTNWTLLFDIVDEGLVVVGIGTVVY